MNFFQRTYASLKAHFIKVVSSIGIALLGLDIAGFADTVKNAADRFIPGGKAAQWVGVGLFALTFLRALAVTYTAKQKP